MFNRCNHHYQLDRWYWCKGGFLGFEPYKSIEAKYVCKTCGRVRYKHPPMDSEEEQYYIINKAKKQVKSDV